MIKTKSLIQLMKKNNINFFSGVPDSVLKELSLIIDNMKKTKHIIASNEGSAVSIGIGHYLATKQVPCIYMQNSGLSNAMNPLISIAHKKVYSIPLVLVIGWRGSPKTPDEPQHLVKGKITRQLLNLLKIKYTILRSNTDLKKIDKQIKIAKKKSSIIACLIEQGTLEKNKNKRTKKDKYNLNKEFFLKTLLENLDTKNKVLSSTGYNSREIMYLRKKFNLNKGQDFYMVGGMGHASSVALGYSLFRKNKIVCIDGDGSLLMHLGSLNTASKFANKNFKYILLNNNNHNSVGNQSTYSENIDFKKLSLSLGFEKYYLIKDKNKLKQKLKNYLSDKKLSFLEVKIANNKIKKLPRPNNLIKIKNQFMMK